MPIYRLPSPRYSSGDSLVSATRPEPAATTADQATEIALRTDIHRSKSLPNYNREMNREMIDRRSSGRTVNGHNGGGAGGGGVFESLIEREIRLQMEKEAEVAALHSPRSSALLLPEPHPMDRTIIHKSNGGESTHTVGGGTSAVRLRRPVETSKNYCIPPGGVLSSTGAKRNPSNYSHRLSGSDGVNAEVKTNIPAVKQHGVSLYNESTNNQRDSSSEVLDRSVPVATQNRYMTLPQQSRQSPLPSHAPPQPPPLQEHWQSSSHIATTSAVNNSHKHNSISYVSSSSRKSNDEEHTKKQGVMTLSNLDASSMSQVQLTSSDDHGIEDDDDVDGEFSLHSFVPQTETPIEREIRLLRQREGSLRRARGFSLQLPPDDDRRNDIIEIPYVPVRGALLGLFDGMTESGSEAVSSDPSMRRLASNRLRHEMLAERERELDLRRQGKISTISEERIDLQPVMHSVHTVQPSISSSSSTSTENVGRLTSSYQFNSLPNKMNSNHVSSAPSYYNSNSYITKSSTVGRDAKHIIAHQSGSTLISPQSYQRPALPASDPPGFSTVNRTTSVEDARPQSSSSGSRATSNGSSSLSASNGERPSWRTSAEQIIEEELKEMKRREEELVQERRQATASILHMT